MKKRIMLFVPPITRPSDFSAQRVRISPFVPLGIGYIGAVLENIGIYEVKLVDGLIEGDLNGTPRGTNEIRYGMSDDQLKSLIEEYQPAVVGVSCIFSAMETDTFNIFKIAKSINPAIITVMGGAQVSSAKQTALTKCPQCDYAIIGEGEVTFPQLLSTIFDNTGTVSAIDGILYRDGDKILMNPKSVYIEDLDTVPFPARHLLPMQKYFECSNAHSGYKNKPFTPLITSRGCPAKCSFCALANHWGKRQRKRSAQNVLDEIELLVKKYGVREIHFEDDNLTADKTRALAIFQGIIDRKLNISWTVPSGMAVFSLDDDLLAKMKESGCYSISLAIENADQEILTRIMRKPVDLKKVPPLAKKIREFGMAVKGFFIIGFPGETKENIKRTIAFARELELDWAYFFIFSPLPGTDIYKTCIDAGYMKENDFDPLRSFYEPVVETPEFTQSDLKEMREDAIIDVNFRNNPNLLKYNLDKAIEDFAQVVSLYPHFDFANHYLGMAYYKKGDLEKAQACFRKALANNPAYSESKSMLTRLGTAQ